MKKPGLPKLPDLRASARSVPDIVRVHGTGKAVAFTSDVTPRYVAADPVEGGKQAVAEAFRNLVAVGATPLAATDNLNFGNPERPEIMGQLVGCIRGISAACEALDMPIVSGNVSLYNETEGRAILPTVYRMGGQRLAMLNGMVIRWAQSGCSIPSISGPRST